MNRIWAQKISGYGLYCDGIWLWRRIFNNKMMIPCKVAKAGNFPFIADLDITTQHYYPKSPI